jgi:predicted Zn-dependent protease
MLKISHQIKLAAMGLMIAGCGGSGGGGSSASNNSNVLSSLTSMIPGMGGAKAQQAAEAAQLGAKALDVMDLESQQRQDEIGQSVAVAITNRYPLLHDQALTDYVNLVGLTVAWASSNPDINYCFGVLDTPDVGAYSAPGGYVFITRGCLAMCQDESELAGVLAHEVAHVSLNHGIEAVKNAKRTDLMVSAAKTYDSNVAAFGNMVDVAADAILVKGYSRAQESAADSHAVQYLAASGYDPNGLLRFLQRLEAASGSGGGMKQLMSTHPGTAERVTAVQNEIAAMHVTGVTLKERFAANVK